MSFQQYSLNRINDHGITSPEGHTLTAHPDLPYVLSAAQLQQGTAPVLNNPAGMLYTSGLENHVLMAPTSQHCESGCLASSDKPDPRVRQVKPLYKPSIFRSSNGAPLPTAYNAVGMY